MVEVRFTGVQWTYLQQALSDPWLESKAFLLGTTAQSEDGDLVFYTTEIVACLDEHYETRTSASVVIKREYVHGLLTKCEATGQSLIDVHTHPWQSEAEFSTIDIQRDLQKFQATEPMYPPFRHGSIVFGKEMNFQGVFYHPAGKKTLPVDRIKICKLPPEIRLPSGVASEDLSTLQKEIFDRQIRAFGETAQRILSCCTVVIVGVGGLGSVVASLLALLGVKRLVLVDPDNWDISNSNRLFAINKGAGSGTLKVEAVRQLLEELCYSRPTVECFPLRFEDAEASLKQKPIELRSLLHADLIIGCCDSATTRLILNEFACRTLTPYIDLGVGIRTENGKLGAAGGRLRLVVPGTTPCLVCTGELGPLAAREQRPLVQREIEVRSGYIQGDEEETIHQPQVASLNAVIGGLAANQILKLCTGLPMCANLWYDLLSEQIYSFKPEEPRAGCLHCDPDGLLGKGFQEVGTELPTMLVPVESEPSEEVPHGNSV